MVSANFTEMQWWEHQVDDTEIVKKQGLVLNQKVRHRDHFKFKTVYSYGEVNKQIL